MSVHLSACMCVGRGGKWFYVFSVDISKATRKSVSYYQNSKLYRIFTQQNAILIIILKQICKYKVQSSL